jgi:thiol-disulfide isomerase/thioredoxin
MAADAAALWSRVLESFAGRILRVETLGLPPGDMELVELDVGRRRFYRESRAVGPGGTPEGICQFADGRTLFTWDPFRPTEVRLDSQPPCLADALEHPLGILLDRDFRERMCRVSARSGPAGDDLLFSLRGQRFVARFAGDPPLLRETWVEEDDGRRTAQRVYRTTPVAALSGCQPAGAAPAGARWVVSPVAAAARHPAPALHGRTLQGAEFDLRTRLGQVAVVDFWATWCGKCRQKLHHLAELQEAFGAGLAVVGVNCDRDRTTAAAYVEARHLSFPVLWDDGALAAAWAVSGLPTLFILDRRHRVVCAAHAGVSGTDLRAVVEPLLDEG